MAIFNMRRVFEDETSTCSVLNDSGGHHICCALELGPKDRIAPGKHSISAVGFGPWDSHAPVRLGWHVIKGKSDAAYRIPSPNEISDVQREHRDAFDVFMTMVKPDDEIRVVAT